MAFSTSKAIRQLGRNLFYLFRSKHKAELAYWQKCYHHEGAVFQNSHYQKLLLGMAGEANDLFLANKRIADFGCGPRGTLCWVTSTDTKIGIDVLSALYLQHFGSAMKTQGMLYVTSTESIIPLPDAYLDIIFSLNAFDHVANPELMASELLRILKPGGEFIGSFNLNEPKTKAEPQTLTEDWLHKHFFAGYHITSWLVSAKPETGYLYQPLLDNALLPVKNEPAILWVRATKV